MQIAYEQIDSEFWYGKYGPFKVVIHSSTGYINATKLCKDGGKQFRHWKENVSSQELIEAVKKQVEFHKPIMPTTLPSEAMFEERSISSKANEINGTYAHPLLVPHIASWTSPRFAIIVSEIVNDYMSWTYKCYIQQQDFIIQSKNVEIQNKDVEIEDICSTLEYAKSKIVPDTMDPSKRMIFALFRVDSSLTVYWVIRCQECSFPKQVKSAQAKLGPITQIYKILDPNSVNLFNRIKEQRKDLFEWKRNKITLKDISNEMALIALVDNLVHNRI